MAKLRKKRHKLLVLLIVPLLAINGYCLWRLDQIAQSLDLPLLGTLSDGFSQIAIIILINSIVIIILLAIAKK